MNSFYININSQDVWGNREKLGKTEAKTIIKGEVGATVAYCILFSRNCLLNLNFSLNLF